LLALREDVGPGAAKVLHEERCGHKECDGGAAIEAERHQA
jgi:hypothetical protein